MRDLIFLSLENWDDIWRRNQFVCANLARRFPERRILFVGKSLFFPELVRHGRSAAGRRGIKQALTRRFWCVPGYPNICVFNPIKPFPNPLPGARAFNERIIIRQIRRAVRWARVRDPLLWVNPYDSGFLVGKLGERGVIYDITDDWELMAESPAIRDRIAAQDRDLCRRADLTIVCSQALYESRLDKTNQLLLLPNGVDAAHYANIDELDERQPGHFDINGIFHPAKLEGARAVLPSQTSLALSDQNWPRPVFGYTGSLHPERVDLELVVQLARAHPKGSVVLVGPHHWPDDSLRRTLKEHPNLHAPGPVPYSQIPNIMGRFDVCIVPHRQSSFVESLNPIKLWEYLAGGKPIVSTDVAGFRDFGHLVRIARDARGFILACREALLEVNYDAPAVDATVWPCLPSLRAPRRAAVANESWQARVDALLTRCCDLNLIEASAPTSSKNNLFTQSSKENLRPDKRAL